MGVGDDLLKKIQQTTRPRKTRTDADKLKEANQTITKLRKEIKVLTEERDKLVQWINNNARNK